MDIKRYVPKAAEGVQAVAVPSPEATTEYGDFVGSMIVGGYVKGVDVWPPREATEKSKAHPGGVHLTPVKGRGFSCQPGDMVLVHPDGTLSRMAADRFADAYTEASSDQPASVPEPEGGQLPAELVPTEPKAAKG